MRTPKFPPIAGFSLVSLLVFPLLAGCVDNQAWTTPIAPARGGREADCPVLITEDGAPPGTATLAIERCEYTGSGESCRDQAHRHACAIGGNIIYGVHWETESRRRGHADFVVGTIGVDPSRSTD
jgi:hypothetical protein